MNKVTVPSQVIEPIKKVEPKDDKGTSTLQTKNDSTNARLHVARAGKPTTADDPYVIDPDDNQEPGDKEELPQYNARQQNIRLEEESKKEKQRIEAAEKHCKDHPKDVATLQQKNKVFARPNDLQGMPQHRCMSGVEDGAIPGSRTGNTLELPAESAIGDKVHDILHDGTSRLKVQNPDKSRADPHHGKMEMEKDTITTQKRKVSLRFPPINHQVSQKELLVWANGENQKEPWKRYLTPDTPNIEILVMPDTIVHVELTHIDANGGRSYPYTLDFYSSPTVTPRPLEASPINYQLMEMVTVEIPKQGKS